MKALTTTEPAASPLAPVAPGGHAAVSGPLDGIAVWGEASGLSLRCRETHDLTPDVRTFLFEPEAPALFRHEAGQFLTLSVWIDGRPVSRCYTISSPPTRPYLLGITVKRHPGGLVSTWLHENLRPGDTIAAEGPFGSFTTAGQAAAKYLFLSAGSGATPLMAMTRTAFDLGTGDDILYVHSARTPADILFRRELDLMTALVPGLRVHHVCERDAPGERWGGWHGLLGPEMLRLLAPDLLEREVFCCGPAPYMAAVRAMLREAGADPARYHEESFTFEELPLADAAAALVGDEAAGPAEDAAPGAGDGPGGGDAEADTTTFSVEFARSGRTIACRAGERILDAAYAAGLTPPSSCGQGMCGTCKTTLLAGTVDMRHQGGIRPREIAQDKVLICCSTPTSDVRIDS